MKCRPKPQWAKHAVPCIVLAALLFCLDSPTLSRMTGQAPDITICISVQGDILLNFSGDTFWFNRKEALSLNAAIQSHRGDDLLVHPVQYRELELRPDEMKYIARFLPGFIADGDRIRRQHHAKLRSLAGNS